MIAYILVYLWKRVEKNGETNRQNKCEMGRKNKETGRKNVEMGRTNVEMGRINVETVRKNEETGG